MHDATPAVTTRQVSVAEAARELGISPETVRRWIKAGKLAARRAIRPQGTVWEVVLTGTTPRGVPPVAAVTDHAEASASEVAHATPAEAWHPSPRHTAPAIDAAPLVASIARLIAELAEVRVISDRRADQLVAQATTIGELRAELASVRARLTTLDAPRPEPEPTPAPPSPFPWPLPPSPNARVLLLVAVAGGLAIMLLR